MKNFFSYWFWDTYDYLGRLILANLIVFAILLAIMFPIFVLFSSIIENEIVLWIICTLVLLIVAAPVMAALLHFVHFIGEETEPQMNEMWIGGKKYFWRSIKLVFIFILAIFIMLVSIWFYGSGNFLPPSFEYIGLALAGLIFWLLIILFLLSIYPFPLMVNQDIGIKKILKRSGLLFIDNASFTIGVFIVIACFIVLSIITVVGPILFMFSFAAIALNSTYCTLMEKYEEREATESAKNQPLQKTSWKQTIEQDADIHTYKKRRKRSIREIFKPWEYKE